MATRAIIFDIDGTLIDSVDLHATAWKRAFAEFGHEISFHDIRQQIGKGGDQLMPVFLSKEEIEARGKALEQRRGEIYRSEYMPQVKPFAGVKDLFERIRKDGKQIALASSAKKEELDVYKKLLGIEGLINEDTSSDDAEKSKPHPDIFEAAVERLKGVGPADVIVIGDTPWDGEAAARAGMRFIGVRSGGFPDEQLLNSGAITIRDNPTDLLANYSDLST